MTKPTTLEAFYEEHINTFAYYQPVNQQIAALNLWVNGFEIYSDAYIIKNLQTYLQLGFSQTHPPDIQKVSPFIFNDLMDHIRIGILFENYMKGELLLHYYVVHKVSDKHQALKKEQHKRPIKMEEIFSAESFDKFNKNDASGWETTGQTITMSSLLSVKYQQVICLPENIHRIAVEISRERNHLHFIKNMGFQYGVPTIEKYSALNDFGNGIKEKIYQLNGRLSAIKRN